MRSATLLAALVAGLGLAALSPGLAAPAGTGPISGLQIDPPIIEARCYILFGGRIKCYPDGFGPGVVRRPGVPSAYRPSLGDPNMRCFVGYVKVRTAYGWRCVHRW